MKSIHGGIYRCLTLLVSFSLCIGGAFSLGAESDAGSTSTVNVIGFLEEWGGQLAGQPVVYRTQVRLGFWYNGMVWSAYPQEGIQHLPDEDLAAINEGIVRHPRSWAAIRAGQKIGTVKSRGFIFGNLTPSAVGWIQKPFDADMAALMKAMGLRGEDFMSWMGIPQRRPLLLVTKPFYQIPNGWRPAPEEKSKAASRECMALIKRFPESSVDSGAIIDPDPVALSMASWGPFQLVRHTHRNRGKGLLACLLRHREGHIG